MTEDKPAVPEILNVRAQQPAIDKESVATNRKIRRAMERAKAKGFYVVIAPADKEHPENAWSTGFLLPRPQDKHGHNVGAAPSIDFQVPEDRKAPPPKPVESDPVGVGPAKPTPSGSPPP